MNWHYADNGPNMMPAIIVAFTIIALLVCAAAYVWGLDSADQCLSDPENLRVRRMRLDENKGTLVYDEYVTSRTSRGTPSGTS